MKSLALLRPLLLALTSVNAAPRNPVVEATVAMVTVRAPTPTTSLSARQETILCNLVQFPITSPGAALGADCGGYNGIQCNLVVSHITMRRLLSVIVLT
jgi:hypothetical protein